jgi:hypothetical protein
VVFVFRYKIGSYIRVIVVLGVMGLGGFYGGRALFSIHSSPEIQSSTYSMTKPAIATTDVPEIVAKQITNSVADVAGIDQIVVLPAENTQGYSVTAQIDLGSETADPTELSGKIQKNISTYFRHIFSSKIDVVDAEVYFLSNGQIVASAGLGNRTYHELAAKAGVSPYDLAVSLESMPTVTGQGENNGWFEIGKME